MIQDLNSIKHRIGEMAKLALGMWQNTYQAFMEHDMDLLASVLKKEHTLNELEKEITEDLVELGRSYISKGERELVSIYADVVGDLELIGDYCKDILERVQIKIEEKLLFSEEAVGEYTDLYKKTEEALRQTTTALEKDDLSLVQVVLKNEEHIDGLVDEYRRRHNQRLIEGLCSPLSCNMFLNMLDFTAAVYYHAKKISRSLLKIK